MHEDGEARDIISEHSLSHVLEINRSLRLENNRNGFSALFGLRCFIPGTWRIKWLNVT